MSSAFPLPFKVDNQAIWQNHSLKFYTMYLVLRLYTTLSFKTGIQIQEIVPPTKSKQLYKGAPFPATASVYFSKYGDCKEYKFRNSSLRW